MAALENIIVRPLVTEKVSQATETDNIYGFQVVLKANKDQIKQAIEKLYQVNVLNVRTIVNPGKLKRRRSKVSKTSKWKKALVQIESGQKIEVFQGV